MLKDKNDTLEGRVELFKEREEIVNETKEQIAQLLDQEENFAEESSRLEKEVWFTFVDFCSQIKKSSLKTWCNFQNARMQEELVSLIMQREEERKKQKVLEDILSECAYMLKDNLGVKTFHYVL